MADEQHPDAHEERVTSLLDLMRRLRGEPDDGGGRPAPERPDAVLTKDPVVEPKEPIVPPSLTRSSVGVWEGDLHVLMTPEEQRAEEQQATQPHLAPGAGLEAPPAEEAGVAKGAAQDAVEPVTSGEEEDLLPTADEPIPLGPSFAARKEPSAPVAPFLVPRAAGQDRAESLVDRLERLERELAGMLASIDRMRADIRAEVGSDVAVRAEALQGVSVMRTEEMLEERIEAVTTRLVQELQVYRGSLWVLIEERFDRMELAMREAAREGMGIDQPPPGTIG